MLPTKRSLAIKRFLNHEELFRCPLCTESIRVNAEGSFFCARGHSFDIAQKGYINLLGQSASGFYDPALFRSRQRILQAGFYHSLVELLLELIISVGPSCRILDAGCGEGFFMDQIAGDQRVAEHSELFALDIVKEAIQIATRYPAPVCWCVANLTQMPFKDGTMDVLLNILSPAHYGEFSRVLKPTGMFIKVLPGNDYLREIRELAATQLHNREYDNEDVLKHCYEHIRVLKHLKIKEQHSLQPEQAEDFLRMTPMTAGINHSALEWEGLNQITIDLEVIAGCSFT